MQKLISLHAIPVPSGRPSPGHSIPCSLFFVSTLTVVLGPFIDLSTGHIGVDLINSKPHRRSQSQRRRLGA